MDHAALLALLEPLAIMAMLALVKWLKVAMTRSSVMAAR